MACLANEFVKRGLLVDLLLVTVEGENLKSLSQAVRVVDLGCKRTVMAIPSLVRYLRRERPKSMLSALTHANVIAISAKLLAQVPTRIVVSERNTIVAESPTRQSPKGLILGMVTKIAYRKADKIVAVSKGAARSIASFCRISSKSVDCIYNPFDVQRICQLAQEEPNHPWYNDNGSPVILGVGRLEIQKDFSTLIKAVSTLRNKRPARLLIIGEGSLRHKLEAEARIYGLSEKEFQILQFQKNPFKFMGRSDAFVLSSRWEGLPGVLIEAMATGCPVVSTKCPSGPEEILENGKWGMLADVGDHEAISNCLDMLITSPQARRPKVKERASEFSVAESVNRYLDALGIDCHTF